MNENPYQVDEQTQSSSANGAWSRGKKRRAKEWELSEEFERQEWSVKEGEVEQKMRQREGGPE